MENAALAVRLLQNYGSDKDCPYCGSSETVLVERKKIIMQLRSCPSCGLRFRWPKESASFAERYYQNDYSEKNLTTELPDAATLKGMMASNFAGSPRDLQQQIAVLKQFLPSGRALDFGCSWGYGVFQLRSAGYEAFGFEISKPRAKLGRSALGVEIFEEFSDMADTPDASVDIILASHVLEHLLSLKEIFASFARILKPGGLLMVLVPNSGGHNARKLGVGWTPMINEKHTLALDGAFFEKNLTTFGFKARATSDPYDPCAIKAAFDADAPLSAEGEELMVIAVRTASGS